MPIQQIYFVDFTKCKTNWSLDTKQISEEINYQTDIEYVCNSGIENELS